MDRKDFLKKTAALCGLSMLPTVIIESCSKQQNFGGPTNVNFTLDLTNSANAALNTVGGYVYSNGVIVVRTSSSTFDALSSTCTHNGCTVGYNASRGNILCPCHGGTFNVSTGAVTGGPPPSVLTKYAATLSGNTLTIKS
jgi:cytochrome b6-f complex iron-sulfur subunit